MTETLMPFEAKNLRRANSKIKGVRYLFHVKNHGICLSSILAIDFEAKPAEKKINIGNL